MIAIGDQEMACYLCEIYFWSWGASKGSWKIIGFCTVYISRDAIHMIYTVQNPKNFPWAFRLMCHFKVRLLSRSVSVINYVTEFRSWLDQCDAICILKAGRQTARIWTTFKKIFSCYCTQLNKVGGGWKRLGYFKVWWPVSGCCVYILGTFWAGVIHWWKTVCLR